MIEGGWGFVWAAYGIVYGGLVLYTLSLLRRLREVHRKRERVAQAQGVRR